MSTEWSTRRPPIGVARSRRTGYGSDADRVVALDTPACLTRRAGQAQRVRFAAPVGFSPQWLVGVTGVEHVDHSAAAVVVTCSGPLLARVANRTGRAWCRA